MKLFLIQAIIGAGTIIKNNRVDGRKAVKNFLKGVWSTGMRIEGNHFWDFTEDILNADGMILDVEDPPTVFTDIVTTYKFEIINNAFHSILAGFYAI